MVDGKSIQESLESIGAQLRDARVEAFLTQTDVGERAGVSRQLVSRIEQGCNGEISAYVAVATALSFRFRLDREGATVAANDSAGLDFS
ncbi:MAG: helix-turn-helix transcriptional regulator [Mycobacterium sp.]